MISVDVHRLLSPRNITVIGASSNPNSIGGQTLRHLSAFGFKGGIFPVNPKRESIQGYSCSPSIASIPQACDVAVVAVPAVDVPKVLRDCGAAGISHAIVLSGGFSGDGEQRRALRDSLRAAVRDSGVRTVGPNCVGVASIGSGAVCAFGGAFYDPDLKSGPVAIVSQSGGVGLGIMAHLANAGIGCHSVVSCGEEVDLTAFDFLDALLELREVSAVVLYMESYADGRALRRIGRRALEVGKPILVMKVGNNAAGQRAAASHTGRMTADHALYRAVFQEGGFIETEDLDEIVDVTRLVLAGRRPRGRNVAIMTASGGWGVMLAEQCERNGLQVLPFAEATRMQLRPLVPSYGSLENPVDVTPAYYADKFHGYTQVLQILLSDPSVHQVVVRAPQGPEAATWANRMVTLAGSSERPIICNWAATGTRDAQMRELLEEQGILCGSYATRLVRAVAIHADYCLRQPVAEAARGAVLPMQIPLLQRCKGATLSESEAKQVVQAYGIRVTRERLLSGPEMEELQELPFPGPLAVKIASADIAHKTEVGGVQLGVSTLEDAREAAASVLASARRAMPAARLDGVLLQEMANGLEMVVGAVAHPDFGPYVVVGFGGILVETLNDFAIGFAPLAVETAQSMVSGLRARQLLAGYRGAAAADEAALCDALVRLSWLIVDHADSVREIEINPLFVSTAGHGVVAADALVAMRGFSADL